MNIKKSRLVLGLRELANLFYIKRTCKKERKKAEKWDELGLRVDWVGRIYTVLNLTELEAREEELVQKARVIGKMKPINDYLTSLDLQEIIYPAVEKVEGSDRSFLLVYSPIINYVSLWFLLKLLVVSSSIIVGIPYLLTLAL